MPLPRVLEPEVMAGADEAAEYDEMDFSVTDQRFAERAAKMAGDAAVIVDIGSGNAKIPLAMCSLLPTETAVCAVEMSAEMLAVAARNREREKIRAGRLHLVRGDAKGLPFQAASVDMVTSNSLVHHIPDPVTLFREVARIARRGGHILIRDLVRPTSEAALDELLLTHATQWSPLQRALFADSLRAALTVDEVRKLLDECDLADVAVSQITDRHWSAERGPIQQAGPAERGHKQEGPVERA
jgi:ubiquinone/menaquinone biosynthesis C-methylase UbiE